jgi:signal transduction histidine kinase
MLTEQAPERAPPPSTEPTEAPVLTGRSVAIALLLALLVALALNPFFGPPFPVVLGRTMFLAMLLLLAYTAARQWAPRWLPRWVAQLLAVAFAAPLGTLVVYLLSVGGNLSALMSTPFALGFLLIAGSGLVLGLIVAFAALYRERDAQARTDALQFALERSQLEKQALDARLSLLQAQIEPHFLFNTLANVQALVEGGSPRAAPVLKSLIAYLKAAMPRLHGQAPTLGDEEALVRAYLDLMLMRMPDRLRFTLHIDPALRPLRFPPMALLTLVENAVRHGIDPGEEGGQITVGAERVGEGVRLWVEDTGVGMAENAQPGTGLANLRQRLQAVYGPRAELRLHETLPHGVRAELILPDA